MYIWVWKYISFRNANLIFINLLGYFWSSAAKHVISMTDQNHKIISKLQENGFFIKPKKSHHYFDIQLQLVDAEIVPPLLYSLEFGGLNIKIRRSIWKLFWCSIYITVNYNWWRKHHRCCGQILNIFYFFHQHLLIFGIFSRKNYCFTAET